MTSLSTSHHVKNDSQATHVTKEEDHSRQSFSRASDYAQLLTIPVAATTYFIVKHFVAYQNVPRPINYSTWFNQAYAFDTGLWGHILCLSLLFFGLGSALAVLHGIDRVKEMEELNQK